ncbi:SGNH hydrolase, partial [Lophium mytilinum]
WVRAWATLGDSYAAGIGAGNRVDRSCSRYDKSYPYFISNDERLGTNQYGRSWQNVACSGATAVDVTKKQIPAITGQQNFITLSAGGNDVGLVSILNDCIFQWKLVSADRCAKTIQETQDKINNDLPDILDQLLHDAKEKLDSVNARIFYTGYAQFFNADSTQCDSVTFKFWSGASGTYLTRELRRTLNDLVVQTNNQIKAATERAGDQVVFVDIDTYFQLYGGRFCDDGALEPAPIRYALLFYERNTRDPTYDFKRRQVDDSADIVANDTFEGEVANWIEDTLEEHPDWKSNLLNGEFEEFNSTNPPPEAQSLAVELLSVSNVASWWVPDTTKRVFHPRPNGHAVIANLVL